jgi:histone H3/H4
MIAIVNVSKTLSPFGWNDYELRINSKVIAAFRHKREEGLAKCLEQAAAAAEKAKRDQALDIIKAMSP